MHYAQCSAAPAVSIWGSPSPTVTRRTAKVYYPLLLYDYLTSHIAKARKWGLNLHPSEQSAEHETTDVQFCEIVLQNRMPDVMQSRNYYNGLCFSIMLFAFVDIPHTKVHPLLNFSRTFYVHLPDYV